MNKKELTEFIDRITQGRKLPIEMYNAKRIQNFDLCICCDVINVELSVMGEEWEFHFCYDDLIEWCISEGLNRYYTATEEEKTIRRDTFELVVENERLLEYTTLFLNEIR